MTKDNILFSIIGLLLGVIAGYVFATAVNQRGYGRQEVAAVGGPASAQQGAGLPENHPPVAGGGAEQGAPSVDEAAVIRKAEAEQENFDAQMEAARVHYEARRYDDAITFLTRANRLRPQERGPMVILGNAHFDANRFEEAEKWYAAALQKNAKDVNVRTDLGLTFLFRVPPDVDRAVQEFRKSLEIDPGHEQTLQNLAVALTKKGDYDGADRALVKLAEVNPSNQSLSKLRSDLEAARSSSKQAQPAAQGKS